MDTATNSIQWTLVFEDNYAFVNSITRRLAGPNLDADDLTQDVFVVVHQKLASLRDPTRLRSWLYGICRRVAAHQRRKHRIRTAIRDLLGKETRVMSATPEDYAGQREIERRLYDTLDRLTEKRREALILYALEGMTGEEIAALLGIPVATVWTRLHAARKDLISQLRRSGLQSMFPLKEALWNK